MSLNTILEQREREREREREGEVRLCMPFLHLCRRSCEHKVSPFKWGRNHGNRILCPSRFSSKMRRTTGPSGLERARGNTETLKHFILFFCQISININFCYANSIARDPNGNWNLKSHSNQSSRLNIHLKFIFGKCQCYAKPGLKQRHFTRFYRSTNKINRAN